MFLFARFFFVILLVLLQLATPLIHAHKKNDYNTVSSLHLPEFEQINTLFQRDKTIMVAPSFAEGEIFTVSSGIKQTQPRFFSETDNYYLITLSFLVVFIVVHKKLNCFTNKTEPIKTFRFLYQISPRAPPYWNYF